MGRKSARYFEGKIKGKPFVYQVSTIKYRDKKGRFAKFNPRRKLKLEVYARTEKVDKATSKLVQHEQQIRKYSVGFAKRKKRVTIEQVENRIARKAKKSKGSIQERFVNGMRVFISGILNKKEKKAKKVKVPWWLVKERHIEKELDEYAKSLDN
jgi:hypothetical protein